MPRYVPNHIEITGGNDYCDKVLNALPHGSGIDCKWEYTYNKKTGYAHFTNEFHCMNEVGFYCGYQPFDLVVDIRKLKHGGVLFNLHFNGSQYLARRYMLRDYLEQSFEIALSDFVKENQNA